MQLSKRVYSSGSAGNNGSGSSDLSIVLITGAIVLDSTAFNKLHVCSGTSADYTVGLPAGSGYDGQTIYFKGSPALTKIVTIDGNASETLDSALNVTLSAYGMIGVTWDGSAWIVQGNASQTISSLPFAVGSTAVALTNQANAEQYFGNSGFSRYTFNAYGYTTCRITGLVSVLSASVNSPRLYPQYSIDGGANWITIGAGTVASGDAMSLAATGIVTTNWIQLPVGAKADVQFRIAQNGGDAAADPAVGSLVMQLRQ